MSSYREKPPQCPLRCADESWPNSAGHPTRQRSQPLRRPSCCSCQGENAASGLAAAAAAAEVGAGAGKEASRLRCCDVREKLEMAPAAWYRDAPAPGVLLDAPPALSPAGLFWKHRQTKSRLRLGLCPIWTVQCKRGESIVSTGQRSMMLWHHLLLACPNTHCA